MTIKYTFQHKFATKSSSQTHHENADPYCQDTANPTMADPAYSPTGESDPNAARSTDAARQDPRLTASMVLGLRTAARAVPTTLPTMNPPL